MKTIFFGAGDYVIPIVEALKKHNLVLVITTEHEARLDSQKPAGRGKIIDYLKNKNINYISSSLQDRETIEKISELKPDIGVLASYGNVIPELVIKNFKLGILNIHPSLLPKHKGPSPIQQTILNNDKKTGLTIIKLDAEIDHGPIVAQEEFMLSGNETGEELTEKLFFEGAWMVNKIIEKLEKGENLLERKQDEKDESFTKKLTRSDGYIDIENPPGEEIVRKMIRAYYPWPGTWTEFDLQGKKLRIKLLPENCIQVEGKDVMKFADFLNGYQSEAKIFLSKLGFSDFS